jgi:signal transduction histidine kinase
VKGSNREILDAEVRDASGHVLFTSEPHPEWLLDASATLPASYGGLMIKMQIKPELAGRLIIGGLPRSRLPLLLALLALAAGLTGIAVMQLRREARFARDRSAFVASASHELRTPLAQIRLVVDMLRLNREKDPVRREAALALVDREVTRLQHLVDTVLRFTRGNTSPDIIREPTDVVAETRSVVAEFLPLAEPRGVHIEVRAAGAPIVVLQGGAVRQVLLNLLDNAVKYGPEQQTIVVQVDAIGGSGARITVQDAGPGVPATERERIWQPFERGSAASARAAGGSGIGLTVVREIAERHGGTARVEALAGPGARFVVEFPGDG